MDTNRIKNVEFYVLKFEKKKKKKKPDDFAIFHQKFTYE